jgi:hypothetical protein
MTSGHSQQRNALLWDVIIIKRNVVISTKCTSFPSQMFVPVLRQPMEIGTAGFDRSLIAQDVKCSGRQELLRFLVLFIDIEIAKNFDEMFTAVKIHINISRETIAL